jgi:hypothetical protein
MAVLRALAADPAAWRYGYELGRQVGLKAGSLYPILIRLADRNLLETRWETPAPGRRHATSTGSPRPGWNWPPPRQHPLRSVRLGAAQTSPAQTSPAHCGPAHCGPAHPGLSWTARDVPRRQRCQGSARQQSPVRHHRAARRQPGRGRGPCVPVPCCRRRLDAGRPRGLGPGNGGRTGPDPARRRPLAIRARCRPGCAGAARRVPAWLVCAARRHRRRGRGRSGRSCPCPSRRGGGRGVGVRSGGARCLGLAAARTRAGRWDRVPAAHFAVVAGSGPAWR